MKRLIEQDLVQWENASEHLPLILRGARQVGKTYLIENFAQNYFKQFISINFELQPEYKNCFNTLDPQRILQEISVLQKTHIVAGESLIFFDEIQACPQAIQALRYFKEKLPKQHVMAAGSLLEFVLKDAQFSMPVGRVTFRYLYPLSFKEFLLANQDDMLCNYLAEISLTQPISKALHERLLERLKTYFFLGGMPAVVSQYMANQNWLTIAEYQSNLLQTYRADFSKYSTTAQIKYLEKLFERTPYLLGQRFKYSHVDPNLLSRDLKVALTLLTDAGIVKPAYATNAGGVPLAAGKAEKFFKLFFLDIGLAQQAMGMSPVAKDFTQLNQGALAEQFVAQELQAYSRTFEPAQLYFWERDKQGSLAEVDFVIAFENKIIPVEVKSGKTGRLKSLRVFMLEKNCSLGIQISLSSLSFENNILTVPLYLISELPRLLQLAADRL